MKLVGFVGNDFNVDQLESLGANVQHHGTVNASLIVVPYNAHIQFDSYDEARYRPYLQLDAEIHGGRGSLGNDITEFLYREDDRLNRSIRYDFTDDELSLLVKKGLYYPDFEVPSLFTDTEFEIPVEMDITEVELNDKRLVYASFDMISDLQTDSEKSGYDLVNYFEKQDLDYQRTTDFEEEQQVVIPEYQEETEIVSEDKQEEQIVEQKPVVEPVKVYESPIEEIADINIGSILEDTKSDEIDDIVGDKDDKRHKAPKDPVLTSHGVRNISEELDAGKARTKEMLHNAMTPDLENGTDFGGISPDEDSHELE